MSVTRLGIRCCAESLWGEPEALQLVALRPARRRLLLDQAVPDEKPAAFANALSEERHRCTLKTHVSAFQQGLRDLLVGHPIPFCPQNSQDDRPHLCPGKR